MDQERRSSTVNVEPGLYVVRYVSSEPAGSSPLAIVRPIAGFEPHVDLISAPGQRPGVLEVPGHSLALIVRRHGNVEVSLDAGDAEAKISVELLTRAAVGASDYGQLEQPYRGRSVSPSEVEMLGHVYRLGDVSVPQGEWLGGPDAPAPIEGLECRVSGGRVGVAIQFMNSLQRGRWSDWVRPESFAGTRQRGSALTALRLRLEGVDAGMFTLDAEAMFLGSSSVKRSGQTIELASPSLADPLVGFRLLLKNRDADVPSVEAA